jgi:uncharacterized membrane protein required for colicin V production
VLFGALRGVLIVLLLLVAILLVMQPEKPVGFLQSSAVYEVLSPGVGMVARAMPGKLGRKVERSHESQQMGRPAPRSGGATI